MNAMPKIDNVPMLSAIPPDVELSKAADIHRRCASAYEQRVVDAKRAGKRRLADLAAERKAEKERHAAEIARLDALVEDAKSGTAIAVEANQKLAAASRAAADMLVE